MSALAPVTTSLRRQALKPLYRYSGVRWHDSVRHLTGTTTAGPSTSPSPSIPAPTRTALSRLPWLTLLRSAVLTTMMCSPTLLKPSILTLGLITHPKTPLFNPETNPLLNRLVRHAVYDQFCAGTNEAEVAKSVRDFKALGYQGVILTFAKEIVLSEEERAHAAANPGRYTQAHHDLVTSWRDSSLASLRMLQPGDVLAMKITGAGPIAMEALQARAPMPAIIDEALTALCTQAKKQGSRLWFDAEQQSVQHGIDDWAIELMRRWNGDGQALVYNTIQAYLKGARDVADRHIAAAAAGGWKLGVKLVRGAYIEHEERCLIHDTKADTDASYNDIADRLISQRLPASLSDGEVAVAFPKASLMLATHNAESAAMATATHSARVSNGLPTCKLECAQVAGMADELGCELIMNYENTLADQTAANIMAPKPYKCLTWGSVGECMGYLHRRAIENRGAVERTKHMAAALRKELWHRLSFN
ncbi:Proline oxidase [Cordyceps fumosorosea ARSEF 2679]|uniref:Proline dehydrogenase n=1 Tax=Cordyceps fumosorosea (strain ARSEF 2679) TaxID=1081104 RepID=A0A162JIQ1_CORFA|nr:Proline oxidase [Cordyceps fumosorosea ARSEF 2679]OAA69592.1 Proline oxidase [Cordyceps fumosorosea ARSEF 2679]